jgi:hypothetical protein
VDRVVIVGERRRWNQLPIVPLSRLEETVAQMQGEGDWVFYRVVHPHDEPDFGKEMAVVRAALDSVFQIEWTPWAGKGNAVIPLIERGTIIRRTAPR